jgi:hypothetical protein
MNPKERPVFAASCPNNSAPRQHQNITPYLIRTLILRCTIGCSLPNILDTVYTFRVLPNTSQQQSAILVIHRLQSSVYIHGLSSNARSHGRLNKRFNIVGTGSIEGFTISRGLHSSNAPRRKKIS